MQAHMMKIFIPDWRPSARSTEQKEDNESLLKLPSSEIILITKKIDNKNEIKPI
jgi:hypothetical protein